VSEVELVIDGRTVRVPAGTTLFDAARTHGIDVPTLCHDPRLEPVGVCRVCVVEVETPNSPRRARGSRARAMTPWSRWSESSKPRLRGVGVRSGPPTTARR